jgi:hypothetical protein
MNIAQILKNNKNFHPDLVSHILFNLPAKSVFRFKLLSNFWHNQISNPCFRDMYHKQAKKNHSVLFYKNFICSTENGAENQTETEWISLNHKTLLDNDTFISRGNVWSTKPVICHSMVCFLNTKDDIDDDIQVSLYCFKTKNLYVLPMDPSSGFYKGIVIGFGIAYISSIKAYKLALFFEKENEDETNQRYPSFNCQVIEISSLDCSNRNFSEWRIIEDTFHDYVNNVHAPVTVENTSYWRACTYDHIISFDFENEIFGIINYPKEIDYFNGNDIMCLLDLHGKLGLAELCSNNEDCFTMVVWNLHDQCSNNWEKVYRICVEDTGLNSIRKLSCMYLHDEEILISSRDCLIFYNLKNNTYKMLDYSAIYSLVGTYHENLYI